MNSRPFVVLCCLLLLVCQAGAASVMINEYYNGSGAVGVGTKMARDEFIEFVIVEKTSAASLAALTFGDCNDATSMLQGVFKFNQSALDAALAAAGIPEFLPGTLLVVKGNTLGAQDVGYNPSGGDWAIELVAGQGASDHSETLINGNVTIGNNGDVVWISSSSPPARNNDTSGLIHAIGHDNAPGTIARAISSTFGAENVLSSTVASGRSVANVGGVTEALQTVVGGSMGQENGGENSIWVTSLRSSNVINAAPEPSRALLTLLGMLALGAQRHRTQKGGAA